MGEVLAGNPGCIGVEPPYFTEDWDCLVGISKWESKDAFFASGITLRPPEEVIRARLAREPAISSKRRGRPATACTPHGQQRIPLRSEPPSAGSARAYGRFATALRPLSGSRAHYAGVDC